MSLNAVKCRQMSLNVVVNDARILKAALNVLRRLLARVNAQDMLSAVTSWRSQCTSDEARRSMRAAAIIFIWRDNVVFPQQCLAQWQAAASRRMPPLESPLSWWLTDRGSNIPSGSTAAEVMASASRALFKERLTSSPEEVLEASRLNVRHLPPPPQQPVQPATPTHIDFPLSPDHPGTLKNAAAEMASNPSEISFEMVDNAIPSDPLESGSEDVRAVRQRVQELAAMRKSRALKRAQQQQGGISAPSSDVLQQRLQRSTRSHSGVGVPADECMILHDVTYL